MTLTGADASSSANKRAFSAFRASSAFRFSSFSSLLPLPPLEPSAHLSVSFCSCRLNYTVRSNMAKKLPLDDKPSLQQPHLSSLPRFRLFWPARSPSWHFHLLVPYSTICSIHRVATRQYFFQALRMLAGCRSLTASDDLIRQTRVSAQPPTSSCRQVSLSNRQLHSFPCVFRCLLWHHTRLYKPTHTRPP